MKNKKWLIILFFLLLMALIKVAQISGICPRLWEKIDNTKLVEKTSEKGQILEPILVFNIKRQHLLPMSNIMVFYRKQRIMK